MAHPARSLPPLSFGDPELDAPANDTVPPTDEFVNVPTLTFADSGPAPKAIRAESKSRAPSIPTTPAAEVYHIPSLPPEVAKDPSFETAPPAKPSWMSQSALPVDASQTATPVKLPDLKPAPPELNLEERVVELLEGLFEKMPPWPDALRVKVSAGAAFAIALVVLWFELGFAVRSARGFISAALRLGE